MGSSCLSCWRGHGLAVEEVGWCHGSFLLKRDVGWHRKNAGRAVSGLFLVQFCAWLAWSPSFLPQMQMVCAGAKVLFGARVVYEVVAHSPLGVVGVEPIASSTLIGRVGYIRQRSCEWMTHIELCVCVFTLAVSASAF